MAALIKLEKVTKEYRGNPAIKDVNLEFQQGEVHAILGENGAGKSTLTKIIAGVVQPTYGAVKIEGKRVQILSPSDAKELGISMVFQETSLVPSMTVAQNLFLGNEKPFNRLSGTNIAAQQFLQSLNFPVDPTLEVASLGVAQRQMVEIARSVQNNARILIFDEPTASLTPEEKGHFFNLINRLVSKGVTIIFISHALEEALEISDRITILCDGRVVISDRTAQFDMKKIINAMVGRELDDSNYAGIKNRSLRKRGYKTLSVQNVSMGSVVKNTSFSAYNGQVTGLFGLIGSGRSETAKIIAGIYKRKTRYGGKILLNGNPVRYRVPQQAVKDGIVYVTEDRKVEGFFETMSLWENLQVSFAAAGMNSTAVVNFQELRSLADHWVQKLKIRTLNSDAKVIELSGGNQQKVVIARALLQTPQVIIFDEPTKGVDVSAITEIHNLINRLADSGLTVVVISSYLPEIMQLSDRILVYRQGKCVEEFSPKTATNEQILFAAVH